MRPLTRFALAVAVGAVGAAAFTSCGGHDPSPPSTPAPSCAPTPRLQRGPAVDPSCPDTPAAAVDAAWERRGE